MTTATSNVSTANRSRGVIPSATVEPCLAPVNRWKYARMPAIPLSAAATTTATPTKRLASTAPSTNSSVEPSGKS